LVPAPPDLITEETGMFIRTLLTALALIASNSQAATLIEVKTPEGLAKVYRDGPHSRMDTGDGYMLVDSEAETMFMVMPKERQVMDMSQMLKTAPPAGDGTAVKVSFKKAGSGPRIAGYTTTQYQYAADGNACGTVMASEQALKDSGLQETFAIMQRMAARADAMMMAFNARTDPCQRAATRFSEHARGIGIPMRITTGKGQLVSEIVRIEKDAKLPPNAFTIPAGYQVQNTGQLLQQLPNIQDMMQQMQQQMQQR
jgi:hypothetical protein